MGKIASVRVSVLSAADKLLTSLDSRALPFEGAGGACGEFDGVFGAGFFGVLF